MNKQFTQLGLVWNHRHQAIQEVAGNLREFLTKAGCQIIPIDSYGNGSSRLQGLQGRDNCGMVIVLGGDGSLLAAARELRGTGIPLLGINLGHLGFLADILPDSMRADIKEILTGNYVEEHRIMLRVEITKAGKTTVYNAFNDLVLSKWDGLQMIEFQTTLDERFLNRQRADGVLVATPTGSTAYAFSAGGPILSPELEALLLISICPHTMGIRPLVVDADAVIEFQLTPTNRAKAKISCDGQNPIPVDAGDRILIRRDPIKVPLIHPATHDYFETLRSKLHWGK